ncbi:hypothetical protein [Streptomyces puniciscabiei]|uniref:hypothetical protein n=1 Tax=Streptomyces puniciscabiei TaxID=164348 RepID=UPI00142EC8F3|nr:hypothetical protein [Streptomyces puniciscabiei]
MALTPFSGPSMLAFCGRIWTRRANSGTPCGGSSRGSKCGRYYLFAFRLGARLDRLGGVPAGQVRYDNLTSAVAESNLPQPLGTSARERLFPSGSRTTTWRTPLP